MSKRDSDPRVGVLYLGMRGLQAEVDDLECMAGGGDKLPEAATDALAVIRTLAAYTAALLAGGEPKPLLLVVDTAYDGDGWINPRLMSRRDFATLLRQNGADVDAEAYILSEIDAGLWGRWYRRGGSIEAHVIEGARRGCEKS